MCKWVQVHLTRVTCAAMQEIVDMMKVITVVRSLAYLQNIQGMAWVILHKPRHHRSEAIRDGRHTTLQTTKTNIHKPTCITWIIYHLSLTHTPSSITRCPLKLNSSP